MRQRHQGSLRTQATTKEVLVIIRTALRNRRMERPR